MADKYDMSDTEKDKLAQNMGFLSWNDYITLDTERVPEPIPFPNSVDYSKVPDLNLSEEDRAKLGQILGRIRRGGGYWKTRERLEELCELREESIGKGRHKTKPSWDYVRDKMNEKYDEDFKTIQVRQAYHRNKHLLADKEE